jgi:hypothetical protein
LGRIGRELGAAGRITGNVRKIARRVVRLEEDNYAWRAYPSELVLAPAAGYNHSAGMASNDPLLRISQDAAPLQQVKWQDSSSGQKRRTPCHAENSHNAIDFLRTPKYYIFRFSRKITGR